MLYAFEAEEAKTDPTSTSRSLPLDETPHLFFGSAQDVDGLVYDGHKSVKPEHACMYYIKSKWFIKAINGPITIESMSLHPYIKDSDGKPPKRYTSANVRKMETIEPMDPKKKLTREMCVIRLGDSDRRFWIGGPLPVGDGEMEESGAGEPTGGGRGGGGGGGAGAPPAERKKDKKEKDRDRKDDRDRDRDRDRERSRTRSRSRKRRK